MQECSQHLPAHDYGAQHEYADMVSKMLHKHTLCILLRSGVITVIPFMIAKFIHIADFTVDLSFVLFVRQYVFQGTDAASATEDHGGCNEEAA